MASHSTSSTRMHLAIGGHETACGRSGNLLATDKFLERVNCPNCRKHIAKRGGKLRAA